MNHERLIILNIKEQETLQTATEKLAQLTGAAVKNLSLHCGPDNGSDGSIEIKLNNRTETFEIEIKNELRGNGFPVSLLTKQQNGTPNLYQ